MDLRTLVNEAIRRFWDLDRTLFQKWGDGLSVEEQQTLVTIMHVDQEDTAVTPDGYPEHLADLLTIHDENDSNGRYVSEKVPLANYLSTGLRLVAPRSSETGDLNA